jgi:hypothetical protein
MATYPADSPPPSTPPNGPSETPRTHPQRMDPHTGSRRPIQANFLVIYSTVKGEYPQTSVAVNTAFGLGASAPSGAGETFTK